MRPIHPLSALAALALAGAACTTDEPTTASTTEAILDCPGEYGATPPDGCPPCGDGICELHEPRYGCIWDCPVCGDGWCTGGEDLATCDVDCAVCGDGTCSASEGTATCGDDCGSDCGDGVCNGTETPATCPAECVIHPWYLVDRVRHCRAPWPICNSAATAPDYEVWEQEAVSHEHQRKTFLAKVSNPDRKHVRRLVFMAAGQQSPPSDDQPTMVTGQTDDWNVFRDRDRSRWVDVRPGSLAMRAVETGLFPLGETFIGLALDARFNYDFSADEKQAIENAYYRWLTGKILPGYLEAIYLVGYSRGGCLVARLAERFARDYPDVPLIVQLVDPVCTSLAPTHPGDPPELGLRPVQIDNPLVADDDYFAWGTDLEQRFPRRDRLAILNVLTGDHVFLSSVHAFAHLSGADVLFANNRAWYRQLWSGANHTGIGNNGLPIDPLVGHLAAACAELGC